MIPCTPATAFCSMVGQAIRQTARPSGPSTIERSNVCSFSGNGAHYHRRDFVRRVETPWQRRERIHQSNTTTTPPLLDSRLCMTPGGTTYIPPVFTANDCPPIDT